MALGLPVSRIIEVQVVISPIGAQFANFNAMLIVGDSDVIDTVQRLRFYSTIAEVANDFGTTAPEYLGATLFFAQSPQPTQLYIGRWARTATHGRLVGGILSATQQNIANFTAVSSGGFHITVDGGAAVNVSGINLSAATTLNGVASDIQTALTSASVAATVSWTGENFLFQSNSTGTTSSIAFLTAPSSGTDLSPLLLANSASAPTSGGYLVQGIAAETPLAAVEALDNLTTPWYGVNFACATFPADSDYEAIATYVQADANPHIFGITTAETAALSPSDNTSIGYVLKGLDIDRVFTQYSSTSPYASISMFGRLLTVNPEESNSTITLMYKQEPGVTPELLTSSQAAALDANNYNYYASYNNGVAIINNGICASGQFIDTIWGVDWLQNAIQTNVFNVLFTSLTKVPQTDSGEHLIAVAIAAACQQGVVNGLIAPGTWNTSGFGTLSTGDFIPAGYYIFQPSVATQAESDRAARKSVPFQVAVKLAGAVHDVFITVFVNQ